MPSLPGFLGPAYKSQSFMADDEILDNWYLEKNESPTAPNPWVMLPCPGFESAYTLGQGIRGLFQQRGRAFAVSGFELYELFDGGTSTLRGIVENDGRPVTINANGDAGNQLWITSGGVGYIYALDTDTLSVEGPAGATVSMGGFLSARFLCLDADTGAFYASDLYDGTTWDPLMVAQSESGDPWRALIVTPDNLIRLLGETSGECWANQGTFPFPFSRIQESGIPYGIVSPFAWTLDTTVSWVAQNASGKAQIVRANGYQPARISTHAVEHEIQRFDDLSAVTGFSYQLGGHEFALFTFPDDDRTWTFDRSSTLWHTRSYWDVTTGTSKAYRPGCAMEAFGSTFVGDRLTGHVYRMANDLYYDVDGAVIRRVRQPPRFSIEQMRLTVDDIQLVMDVGQGLVATGGSLGGDAWGGSWGDSWGDSWTSAAAAMETIGTDPQMMLQISRDGGKTFPLERWAPIGPIGAWNTRVYWTMLGQGRNLVFRFVATDPVPWAISDCLIRYRVGTS